MHIKRILIFLTLLTAAVIGSALCAEKVLRGVGAYDLDEMAAFIKVLPFAAVICTIVFLGVVIIRRCGRITLKKLDEMEGHEFEYACAGILRANGFKNVEVTKGSGDFGVDIIAEKRRERYAVQCKRYDRKLNNSAVQQVIGGLAYYGCDRGAVMTNSYFTAPARRLAEVNSVELWDRDVLAEMIDRGGTKRAVKESLYREEELEAPEELCGDTVLDFLRGRGIAAEVVNYEMIEESSGLLIEVVPETGVRVDDIRALMPDLAEYGGWEYAACIFPSRTPGTVGIEIPLSDEDE